jgi:P-type conjugative transfer protein TrbJ
MRHSGRIWWVLMTIVVLTGSLPRPSHAQVDLGGGGIIVFDPSNFAKNTITAAQMLKQVINSTKEVELMLRNLIATGWAGGDVTRLLRLLDEVLAVEHALHYQLSNLDALMQERYPGTQYAPPTVWWEDYQQWANTSLATLRGTLDTVHEQLRVEQRLREEQVLAELAAKTANAAGNLDVTQTGNMITAQVVEELRKTRQMLGALINAENVAHTHSINREAVSERLEHDALERSRIAIPTRNVGPGEGFLDSIAIGGAP